MAGAGGTEGARGGTDEGFIAGVYYRFSVQLTANAARILRKKEDADRFEALAEEILKDIHRKYFSPGHCLVNTHTGYLLTLRHGLDPDKDRIRSTLRQLFTANNNRLQTGSVVEWMYAYMAGIRQAEDSVGFQKVKLAPVVDSRVGQVDCEYNSASGLWKSF